ncbi:MAG TPA: hypothetical protein VIL86_04015 [Tepidisphaeraceae bacterium]
MPGEPRDAIAGRWAAPMTLALGFFCFMPYPALNVLNTSAVQIGNALTVLMVLPCLAISWKRQPFYLYLLILAPLCLSMLKVAAVGGDLDLSLKTFIVWAMACLTMITAQAYAPRYALHLMTGIALATLVHVAVGGWQFVAFSNGEFPLVGLYVNQSFLSVQDNATIIAKWTQRPFGIFPEPSAMSSSLAPWVLFWLAMACGIVRLKVQPQRWQRVLFNCATAGGLGLIILSRSGHTAVTLAGAALIVGIWLKRSKATPQTYAAIVAMFSIILPVVVWFAAMALGDRLGGASAMGNSSWQDRTDSLVLGFKLLTGGEASTLLFGFGPGLTSPALWDAARLEAVWSVSLGYIYETGLFGALVVFWIGRHVFKKWRESRGDLVFAAIAVVWLVGITLTTSYQQLLPLWLALGWMTVWPAICEPAGAVAARTARPARLEAPPVKPVRRREKWIPLGMDGDALTDQMALTPDRPRRWTR